MMRTFFKVFAIVLLAGVPLSVHADTVPTCCCRADPPECQTLFADPFTTTDYDKFCEDNTFDTGVGQAYKTCEEMSADESYLATETDTAQPTDPLPTPGPAVGPKSTPIQALGPTGVAADPICWPSADACKVAVETAQGKWDGTNWIPDPRCQKGGANWGKCTAAPQVTAQITIGKKTFSDLGDYIQTLYNYLIGIAGIVATILIMAAGFDWILAAGSAEAIAHAKTKIVNATMGLVLVIGSYLLLSTINPDLVKLKLPQVYLLRRIIQGSQFCKDQPEKVAAVAGKSYVTVTPAMFTIDPQQPVSDPNASPGKMAMCGFPYYIKDGAAATCLGSQCPPVIKKVDGKEILMPQVCAQKETIIGGETKFTYNCIVGSLAGTVTGQEGNWEFPWIDDGNLTLLGACTDGWVMYVAKAHTEENKSTQSLVYDFTFGGDISELEKIDAACQSGKHGPFRGFALAAKMEDNEWSGGNEWRVLGKGDEAGKCNKQLLGGTNSDNGLGGYETLPLGGLPKTGSDQGAFQSFNSAITKTQEAIKKSSDDVLLSLQDLKNGYICDIVVTDSTFGK